MRYSQLLILALLGVQVAAQSSCDPTTVGQATGEDATATATAAAGGVAPTAEDGAPEDGRILSQAPPIRAFSRGNPTVDALYMMFPALGSLIHWGSLFPAYSFLGGPTPGSEAAASKVVLVLADDAAAKTRVTRQNDPASQPANPFAFLNNFQGLPNMPNFDPNIVGQSLMNPQTAFTALQGLPGLSGLQGMLGAAAPVPAPPAAAPAADAAEAAPATPTPEATPAAAPAAALPVLGQAWAMPTLPNFDANNMLGQTMSLLSQMPPPQAPANLPPANFDFLGQMFPTPAASDISEVRVRPEVAYAPQAQMAQLKIKSALEKEAEKEQQQQLGEDQERVPLLWFRMPSNPTTTTTEEQKTLEDLQVEAKLRAFERQVIAELKMLQKIELMAKEMRSSASASQGKESPYKISYPLSRTPVHKITRSDIERALRDDYVRRLLQKEAQRKARITDTHRSTGGGYKRQAEKPGQSMSKEDIVQIMAYAYRMASEQMEAAEKGKQDKIYAAYRTDSEAMERQHQEQVQREQQQIQQQQRQMIQQNPMMIQQQQQERQMIQQQQQQQQERQMMADPQAIQQQRQMMQGPHMIQQAPMMPRQMPETPQMIQQGPMMIQQQQERQMMAEPQAMQQQMQQQAEIQQNPTMMQRQMMAEDNQANQQQQHQMIQQNPSMMQRQMLETDTQAIQQQRQWAEEQAQIQQNAMMMQQQQQPRQMMQDPAQMIQQNPSIMMQQRQMSAENPATQQQLQWTEDPTRIQQIQQQMQQRSEDQGPMMTIPAERQWAEEKTKAIQQLSQPEEQENQETDDELILGEAGPQMPENEGIARHKGNLYGVFRNRDSISVSPTVDALGLGGNQRKKGKGKGKSGTNTVVNLYYTTPVQQRPSYGQPSYAPPSYGQPSYGHSYAPRPSYVPRPSYAPPSYGTSYGGGGYGSNAYGAGSSSSGGYRAAVGNDEVDEMLRRHQTLARTINPQPDQVARSGSEGAASMTTTRPETEPEPPTHRVHKRLANFQSSKMGRVGNGKGDGKGDGKGVEDVVASNSASKSSCSCGRSQCPCGSSCQCGSNRRWSTSRCPCQVKSSNRRLRRSTAEYGTLETIDEGSLNELRREYKMGLKEITLSPDEDPAEALMRYNAASIREALERASQEPLEIGGDQYGEDMPQEPEEDAEQMQQQYQHHHHHHHHPYHYQDFVRLTTTAKPLLNTTEESVTSEETTTSSTSTSTTTESPPTLTETPPGSSQDEEEMQQDSAASETLRVAEAMSQQKEEIHELHKAVHALKMQLLDANRRCMKIQEQLKVNLVKEPAKEEEAEEELKKEKEKKTIKEEEPKAKVEELIKGKEPEKPKEPEEKAEVQPEQEEDEDQEEDTESTTSSTTTTETTTSPSPPVTPTSSSTSPTSPPPSRTHEANAIAKVDEHLLTASASASASLDANKLTYEEEEEGNWQRILANRGYDTDYLTKSHERQYAEGGNLELSKGLPYEAAPLSQEYTSYPDFQADEPASPADTEGKAKRSAAVPLSVKLRAHLLNVALKGSDRREVVATPPTPYALRGKFVRRRSTAGSRKRNTRISQMSQEESLESPSEEGWVRATRQVARLPAQRPKKKVSSVVKKETKSLVKKINPTKKDTAKKNTTSSRVSTQASVSSTKLDRLVDVLSDLLHLQVQKERRASALKSTNGLSKSGVSSSSSSSKLIKRKRQRRRQLNPPTTNRSPSRM